MWMFTEYEYTDRRYISYYCQPSNSPAPLSCRATVLGYIIAGSRNFWFWIWTIICSAYCLSQDLRSKIQIVICYFRIKSVLKLHNFLFITDLLLFLLTALSWLLFLLFWFRHFWHRLQNLNWSHWKLMNHDYRFLPAWTFLASSSWKIYRVLFWKVSQ